MNTQVVGKNDKNGIDHTMSETHSVDHNMIILNSQIVHAQNLTGSTVKFSFDSGNWYELADRDLIKTNANGNFHLQFVDVNFSPTIENPGIVTSVFEEI